MEVPVALVFVCVLPTNGPIFCAIRFSIGAYNRPLAVQSAYTIRCSP